jgi:hypothetical protein
LSHGSTNEMGSNVRVPGLAPPDAVPADGVSWLDELAVDVGGASRDKFDIEGDVDLQAPVLRDMLSDRPLVVRMRAAKVPSPATGDGESVGQKTPVKWEVKF